MLAAAGGSFAVRAPLLGALGSLALAHGWGCAMLVGIMGWSARYASAAAITAGIAGPLVLQAVRHRFRAGAAKQQ